ncbi:MAG: carbohydrate ABC transporter permease [Clostridiales bacterium]|jgi:multiple sugar transport system permease protein|nr:carbohydrate ABC transporter permease [Clostridiales bacterium]
MARFKFNRKTGGESAAYTVAFAVMLIFCASYIFAFLWAIFAATKTHAQIVMEPFKWHDKWLFSNFIDVFKRLDVRGVKVAGMIGNSLWYTLGASALGILGPALMAYALTKFQFVGRKALISVNFVVMILPIIGALPAQYRMFSRLGFVNSPLLLISSFGCFGGTLLILMSFFRNLSDEYRDAARIDGAGEYRILFTIMFPLAKAPIFALFVMNLVGVWNDYMTPLLFLPRMPTLATGVYLFSADANARAEYEIMMAATVLTAIPPLILFLLFNKAMLTSLSIGGLKE